MRCLFGVCDSEGRCELVAPAKRTKIRQRLTARRVPWTKAGSRLNHLFTCVPVSWGAPVHPDSLRCLLRESSDDPVCETSPGHSFFPSMSLFLFLAYSCSWSPTAFLLCEWRGLGSVPFDLSVSNSCFRSCRANFQAMGGEDGWLTWCTKESKFTIMAYAKALRSLEKCN